MLFLLSLGMLFNAVQQQRSEAYVKNYDLNNFFLLAFLVFPSHRENSFAIKSFFIHFAGDSKFFPLPFTMKKIFSPNCMKFFLFNFKFIPTSRRASAASRVKKWWSEFKKQFFIPVRSRQLFSPEFFRIFPDNTSHIYHFTFDDEFLLSARCSLELALFLRFEWN